MQESIEIADSQVNADLPVIFYGSGQPLTNAVLKRLIEEVRNEVANGLQAYNRSHNRHNRSK
jgi:hypothetical protein